MIGVLVVGACDQREADGSRAATEAEADAVRDTMRRYVDAALARRGDEAASVVGQRTLDHYDWLRTLALHAGPTELDGVRLMDRMRAITLRARYSPEELKGSDGRSCFARFVADGLANVEGMAGWSLRDVRIEGDEASAEYVSKTHGASGMRFQFHRVPTGAWRIHLESAIPAAELLFQDLARRSGVSEALFLQLLAGEMVGRSVDETIWTAPVAR